MQLHTYLNYGGNCREALEFYQEHLGAKILGLVTWGQMPGGTPTVAPADANRVMHARLALGGTFLMASDAPVDSFQPMRSVYLSLTVDSDEEAERIHAILAEGGEIFMPLTETFYATRFSMLRDKFGTSWMVVHEKPMPAA
jgi:PhnB protein